MILTGQSGWGRYCISCPHGSALSAVSRIVLGGMARVSFQERFVPTRRPGELRRVLQRIAYSAVVFVLFPLMIWTGFAMSPAITSVFPVLVIALGGQQSARTIHFVVASLLVLFLVGHVVMVYLAGFTRHVGAMILGGNSVIRETQT